MKKILSIVLIGVLLTGGFGGSVLSTAITNKTQTSISDNYDMVIIAPNKFFNDLQPLIDHKNSVGIQTFLKTTEEIYDEYNGRDESEQIKYFIYESVENLGIEYVLLVGDAHTTPIRKTEVNHIWPATDWTQTDDVITDMYYADIYDYHGNFSSWDSNNDNIFSEFYLYNLGANPSEVVIIDEVDMFPDIGVGRIPCENGDELEIVINKIITYETQSNDDYFHNIILAGQDGFPEPGYQLEMVTEHISEILTDFTQVKLYESMNNLNPITINREINKGAGFFICLAHGRHMAFANYHKVFIKGLHNENKLPIAFLGGCYNAELDNSLHKFLNNNGFQKIDNLLQLLKVNTKKIRTCIAWEMLKHEKGGSIATIGGTRSGTLLRNDPLGGFSGFFIIKLFESYEPGITLSQMYNKAVTSFINESWKNFVTLQKIIILGDPSLKIGGYN